MPLVDPPDPSLSVIGCGLCGASFQDPVQGTDPDTGGPVTVNDEAAASAECSAHVDDVHPLLVDAHGQQIYTDAGNPARRGVTAPGY